MAVRFYGEFKNEQGAEYRVRIYDEDYSGSSPVAIPMQVPGFELSYDGSTSDRYQWVIGSSVTCYFIANDITHENFVALLSDSAEGRFTLTIEQVDGAGYNLLWCGVILGEQIEVEDTAYPLPFSVVASDDLANLEQVDYAAGAGTPYFEAQTVAEHFANVLGKLRTASLLDTTILRIEEAWQSNQQSGTGYDRILIGHQAFYESTELNVEFKNSFEVLESLCSQFGLRIFHQDGRFVAQSLSAASDSPTSVSYSDIDSSGVVTQSTITRPTMIPGDSTGKRLQGWRNTFLNPLSKVVKKQDIGGSLFFAGTNLYTGTSTGAGNGTGLLNGSVTTADIEASTVLSVGDPVAFSFSLALIRQAVAFTGDDRVLVFKVSVQLRVGNQYINRPVTFSGSYTSPVAGGGTAQVASHSYGSATWSTNSASRLEFVTPAQQMLLDWTSITDFGITMEGLPAGFTGDIISWSFECDGIDADGNVLSNSDNAFNYATDHIQTVGNIRIYSAQTYLIEGETATYQALNSASNGGREKFEMPENKLGDELGPNSVNHIFVLDGSDVAVNSENWKRIGETESLEINALACREIMAGQIKTIEVKRGDIRDLRSAPTDALLTMECLLKIGLKYYAPFTLSFSANDGTYSGEWFELKRDDTGISVPSTEFDGAIINPNAGTNAFEAAQETAATTGTNLSSLEQSAVTSVNGVGPTDGAVVIDAGDIDYGGGETVKDAIGGNVTDITTLQSAVQVGATTVALGGGNNGVYVDTTAADVSLQIAKTDVLVVTGTTITNKQATIVESTLKTTGTLTVETGVGVQSILAKNSSTRAVIALQDSGSTDANQVAIASSGDDMVLQTGGSTAVTIDSTGQVGIGATAPSAQLDVVGDVEVTGAVDITGNVDIIGYQNTGGVSTYSGNILKVYNSRGPWEGGFIDLNRTATNTTHTTATNIGDEFTVGKICAGWYGHYTFHLNNVAKGEPFQRQHLVIFDQGEVGVGWPNSSNNFDEGDAALSVRTDYLRRDTALKIRCAIQDSLVDPADQILDKAIHVLSNTFVSASSAPPTGGGDTGDPGYSGTIVSDASPQDIFIVYSNGDVTINGDVTHTGDTTQTGNVSVTGTITSTGVTKASGLEATSNADSLVLKSPNGTRWRVTVDNLGILTTTSL